MILNSAMDRPWSQYFCCMLIGNVDFVRHNPIATKRVVRALFRATDICAAKPDWVARRLTEPPRVVLTRSLMLPLASLALTNRVSRRNHRQE